MNKMNHYFAILCLGWLLVQSPYLPPRSAPHPLKMCVCDVKPRPGATGQLTLKFKFFWDDLETVLEKQTGRALTLIRPSSENDQLLTAFVRANFDLKINGAPIALRLAHSEVQDVVLIVEFTGDDFRPAPVYEVDLTNQILLDAFSDQYNLVRFDFFADGNLETLRFERADRRLFKTVSKK